MRYAVVIDAIRTPIGRASADNGMFRDVRADDLSAFVMKKLVERTGVNPAEIEDVKWGCCQQQGEQGFDVARNAALQADLPIETGGVTIHRNCASSLTAINMCAQSIAAECEDVQIGGGVEHMEHVPMTKDISPSPQLFRKHSQGVMNMGLTAERLAEKYQISRTEQDEFACRSHKLASDATSRGLFAREIVPTWGRDENGRRATMVRDQCIRDDCSMEGLSKLKPAFRQDALGSITPGNSSPTNVGAAALLIMSEEKSKQLGLKPMARIRAMAVAGVDPSIMGIGPVPAVRKVLQRAKLKLQDIGAIELNEAFAAQALAVLKELGLSQDKVNTRGGAIAIGHPLGASGARISTTLLHRMRDEGIRYGLATMCVGMGQGVATLYELCDDK